MPHDIKDFFIKYKSDKFENGYCNVYNDIFGPKQMMPVNLLEIGIGTLEPTHSNMLFWKNRFPEYEPGASLRAFRDYFPNGTIYGVDIQEDCMIKDNRIQTFLIDSRNRKMASHYLGHMWFDFIVDDGDHSFRTQIETFENFFRFLTIGGVYILEDLEHPDYLVEYFEKENHNFELRDRMIIIQKDKITTSID